jgi:hypothetical protein
MKLYVCWGTFQVPGVREHPCKVAYDALVQADFEPEVIKAHSVGFLPRAVQTGARKKVEDATGSKWVPALETDDGEWISGSSEIVAWAEQHARV